MKTASIYCLLFLPACWSCERTQVLEELGAHPAPVTDFLINVSGECKNENYEITFQNQSTGIDSVVWDLGDGTTTSELNPRNIYAEPGDYLVTLTAYRNGQATEARRHDCSA